MLDASMTLGLRMLDASKDTYTYYDYHCQNTDCNGQTVMMTFRRCTCLEEMALGLPTLHAAAVEYRLQ
jgi:hypothetical protein